jgi:hypothetical protein
MKRNCLLSFTALTAFALPMPLASAYQEPTAQGTAPSTTPAGSAQVARARSQELRQLTAKISEETGVRIVADSSLGRKQVTAPETTVAKDNIEDYLTRLARRVSNDVLVLKIYLPFGDKGRFTPDAIAQVARAQMELLGRPAPNTVQIQGKTLSVAEAEPVIQTLGLEPVYVLTSRQPMQSNRFVSGGAGATGIGDPSNVVDSLVKQLGVANVSDIPSGTYKVNLPAPNGAAREATVIVENAGSSRSIRVMVREGSTP